MKKEFEKLTDEELYNLKDEEFENYCKLALAKEGLPLVFPEPVPEIKLEKEIEHSNIRAFELSPTGVLFKNKQDAVKMMEQVNDVFIVNTSNVYSKNPTLRDVRKGGVFFQIKERFLLSSDDFEANKIIKEKNLSLKKNYEKEVEKRDLISEKMGEIIAPLEQIFNKAREKGNGLRKAAATYGDYLDLAQGNKEIAKSFFTKFWNKSEFKNMLLEREVIEFYENNLEIVGVYENNLKK